LELELALGLVLALAAHKLHRHRLLRLELQLVSPIASLMEVWMHPTVSKQQGWPLPRQ
jgi:hypothetical protein